MNQEKIGKFIYEQRKKLNLTQKELADKLSVTSQAISKWENGRGIPDIEMLNELSKIFNVDIKNILNGEKEAETQTEEIPKKNKKNIYIIIELVIIAILLIILLVPKQDNFSFHALTSENSCFGVKGVIAYNKNKKSIYISNIECSNEEVKEYLDIECILYESVDNIDNKIQEYGSLSEFDSYDINKTKTLNELLSNVEFNIDNYECSCNNIITCNNLYIRINALNIDNKVITYNIPIELENNCIN